MTATRGSVNRKRQAQVLIDKEMTGDKCYHCTSIRNWPRDKLYSPCFIHNLIGLFPVHRDLSLAPGLDYHGRLCNFDPWKTVHAHRPE